MVLTLCAIEPSARLVLGWRCVDTTQVVLDKSDLGHTHQNEITVCYPNANAHTATVRSSLPSRGECPRGVYRTCLGVCAPTSPTEHLFRCREHLRLSTRTAGLLLRQSWPSAVQLPPVL